MCVLFEFVVGKERWMDQQQRLDLVKKHEDGIIDHHSTNYEKYVSNVEFYMYFRCVAE